MKIRIEDILDNCISEVRSGKTVEDVLRQYPEVADEIRPLLGIACDLQNLPEPSTSTSNLIRTMAKLSTQQAERKTAPQGRKIRLFSRPVLARVAAVILIIFIAGWTTVTSSAQALPGDLLYPIKLFTERAKFFLTINHEDKAELRIVFSEERIKEFIKKHSRDGSIDKNLLSTMLNEAKLALDTAPELPEVSRNLLNSRIASLSEFQKHTLESLKKRVSPEEQQQLEPYINMCGQRCGWMRQVMTGSQSDSNGPKKGNTRGCWDMCPMK